MKQAEPYLLEVASRYPSKQLTKKRTLFYQGEVPRSVYIVRSGLIRLYNITNEGEEKTIGFEGPGSTLPTAWLFGLAPVTLYYYEAVNNVVLHSIPRDEFEPLLEQDALLGQALLRQYAQLYVGSTMHINAIEQSKAQDKVVRILQFLVHRFGDPVSRTTNMRTINVQFTHQDIASLIGTTRETVAIEFSKLTKKGVVAKQGGLYQIDVSKLLYKIGENEYEGLEL